MRWRAIVGGALAASLMAGTLAGQTTTQRTLAARAFDLERSGNYLGAVNAYRTLLGEDPASLSALLGLERALTALSRLPEMAPDLAVVLASPEPPVAVFGIGVRVWTAVGAVDTVRRLVERWTQAEPGSSAPWQEWGMAAYERRDFALAREAYAEGRVRLGRANALALELAQLASLEGNYAVAVREWLLALDANPDVRAGAVALLGQAPAPRRSDLLALLAEVRSPVAERLGAVLAARWGDPVAGYERLTRALPADREARVVELRQFLDEIGGSGTQRGRLTEARVQEALAELVSAEESGGHWLEAAQAYSDAGDAQAARRMLGRLASTTGVPSEVASSATVALVGVLADEGRLAEADSQLAALQGTLSPDDRDRLARRVASGWVRAGNLERAATLVARDSSVDGMALAGRIKIYQGDLATGAELLRGAGPFTGSRDEASARLSYLALLQVIGQPQVPGLGEALLALEQGDTAAAATGFERVAAGLPPEAGGAELALLAGRLHAAQGREPEAERMLLAATRSEVSAAAAAGALELARLEERTGRREAAMARLEGLILAWPTSTAAPDARRLLDALRGGIPGRG